MTFKEELEILRGEPIPLRVGNPLDIPAMETSNAEALCKQPTVSVIILAYNHESYIRQAIEGAMMQQTDFAFEVVIGEDCSQDKTRDICFEYQKKHPDKIRVLWWHENVSKFGGNFRRCLARCRGEFIALCEGDDYWIDPHKLQKQVEALRTHPHAGLCFGRSRWIDLNGNEWGSDGRDGRCTRVIPSDEFVANHVFGWDFKGSFGRGASVSTPTAVFRRSALEDAWRKYDIFSWKLLLGDEQNYLGLGCISDVCFISEEMAVYRRNPGSSVSRHGGLLRRDHILVRMYFAKMMYNLQPPDISPAMLDNFRGSILRGIVQKRQHPDGSPLCRPRQYLLAVLSVPGIRRVFLSFRSLPVLLVLLLGVVNPFVVRVVVWFQRRFLKAGFSKAGYPFFRKFLGHA